MEHEERLKAALADRYQIEREIGSGGMATVYLAQDLKHDRKVAVKVLRPELAAVLGAERFLSEIKTTANLQHPHILPLFDSGEADGFLFYVMPYVEGESLRARLDREKQLAVEEALGIAKSVASVLDYAHRHGVIHRDIKPANILLHDGQPMVADFGIALAVRAAGGERLTETGLSLGTPQYMSPEQAAGDREVDGRSDLYSLGAVLYEMLTGEPPHSGPTVQATLAKLLTDKPRPVTELRDTVPTHVAATVHRALAKLPADRFGGAEEFSRALASTGTVIQDGATHGHPDPVQVHIGAMIRKPAAWGAVALALMVGIVVGRMLRPSVMPDGPNVRFSIPAEPRVDAWESGTKLAVSPDGQVIVYVGDYGTIRASAFNPARRLYRRVLGSLEIEPLENTEGASFPCFSPDGQWIAFLRGDDLVKIAVDGGPDFLLADIGARGLRGMSWGKDDVLVYAADGLSGLVRVDSNGQVIDTVGTRGSGTAEGAFRWPQALPSGRGALVTVWGDDPDQTSVGVLDFDSGEFREIGTGVRASLLGEHHLMYSRQDGTLLAASFDQETLEVGQSVPMLKDVMSYLGGASQFAVSPTGTLVYQAIETWNKALALVDREGRADTLPEVRDFAWAEPPRVSPTGNHIALPITDGNDVDIWLYDVRDRSISVLATEGSNRFPNWTPDETRLTFASTRDGVRNLYWQPVDGNGPAELLVGDSMVLWSSDWSPDGNTLIYQRLRPSGTGHDIFTLDVSDNSAPRPLFAEEHDERRPRIDPFGRWVAYVSNETGVDEVYVRPFPGGGPKTTVSAGGGNLPVWSPNGEELFYRNGPDLWAARVSGADEFRVLGRTLLFSGDRVAAGFDVMPDGEHFVMFLPEHEMPSKLVVITNFLTEVEERLQALAGAS